MLRRLLCFFGFHRRSRRHVVERDRRLHTICVYCGTAMVQNVHRVWETDRASKAARSVRDKRDAGPTRHIP